MAGFTIAQALRALFPRGYVDFEAYEERLKAIAAGRRRAIKRHRTFVNPPCQAPDLFAIAAFLLLRSGAYHHVSPAVPGTVSPRMITVTQAERNDWVSAGQAWRGDGLNALPAPPTALVDAWNDLLQYEGLSVYREADPARPPRRWWRAALALLVIADEASKDMGFEPGSRKSAQALQVKVAMRSLTKDGKPVFTISGADPDQVCVLPKSRTPKVGCTLRSLSHNLALLPPRGLARAYWSPSPDGSDPSAVDATAAASAPFNLVVVPSPYRIQASAFHGAPAKEGSWGWFEVKPHWCPSSADEPETDAGFADFYAYVEDLLEAAKKDVGVVHGLVLPEVALSHAVFLRLCDNLAKRDGFELLISGLFDFISVDRPLREGNFAAMARFPAVAGTRTPDISIREKHHRWRVDAGQIESYALGSALDANRGWWERIDILSRSLDMFVVRGGATVTTLICEDLARNDPCQELVRGIGPNLVVALLMDGPQLKDRWPARYATVLADDPGSSVLTLTSLGLIRRSNETGQYPPCRKIGLWRDDSGKTVALELPGDAQALCLTLQAHSLEERTLDGRGDGCTAQSWRLTGVGPVRAVRLNATILDGRWPNA